MKRIIPLMKILVCGTRTFTDYKLLRYELDRITFWIDKVHLLSGAAKGVDALAERWAHKRHHLVSRFHADWSTHGKAAGPIRNNEMLDAKPDLVIGVWDCLSKGTEHCLREAKRRGIKVKIIRYLEQ